MEVTIGGNRVGSGKKMKAHLNNYYRSTHNLSEKFASSMGSGILYPCLVKPAMRGDAFDIIVNADARTIPTEGPLFGSYKMQVDIYQCPVRLYQAILHNNPLAIGLKMSQIKLPKITIETVNEDEKSGEFSNSSLLKYLGMSGLGSEAVENQETLKRTINAIPAIAYYDIFKNYYANKQEEKGYVISPSSPELQNCVERIYSAENNLSGLPIWQIEGGENARINPENDPIPSNHVLKFYIDVNLEDMAIVPEGYSSRLDYMIDKTTFAFIFTDINTLHLTLGQIYNDGCADVTTQQYDDKLSGKIRVQIELDLGSMETEYGGQSTKKMWEVPITCNSLMYYQMRKTSNIEIQQFDLKNIDDFRYSILSHHTLGSSFSVNNFNYAPYNSLFGKIPNGVAGGTERDVTKNKYAENGLVLKTYQNDIFNNWLNTEWLEGEGGINEISSVTVTDGAFSMDALNFAEKLYDMLNRIAVAGNTYEDWQDVVYEKVKARQIESPIYCGGMSQEVYFDEIVQTAPAEGSKLGTLGGRGRLGNKKKGGKIHIKCDEACFIIGIVSLTPRVYYTQGNEFYMTELDSLNDLHKPPMDGIGFQDLLGERLAWWDTKVDTDGVVQHRSKIGKLPAWIEYMTSYDKAYGDFANTDGKGYMILNRNYERDNATGGIKDATTYVDPAKFNYTFAYTELEAQNFWVEIDFDIKARRLMSARVIPNV